MDTKTRSSLGTAIAAIVGGICSNPADATVFASTLKSVISYSSSGNTSGNLTSSTATWQYDDVTGLLTQTGGTFNVRFTIVPSTTLFRHTITGLVIGAGSAASATSYRCTEGNFGPSVSASICGNYNFGANYANESTATWGPGIAVARTIAGDDVALGLPQQLHATSNPNYDSFTLVSWIGTTLTLGNAYCNPAAPGNANGCATLGGFNTGYRWVLDTSGGPPPPSDTTPDPFFFTDVTGAALNTTQTSNSVTISGIDTLSPISVAGGEYSIGCTPTFTTAASTVTNGQTVCVRHTSAATNSTAVNTTLTVGGVSDTFTSTTASDTTPDAFSFPDKIQQPLGTLVESDPVTISGINGPAAIAVVGGEYSIGAGAFTATPGLVSNGQSVRVRHTTSSINADRVNTQLTVGGVTALFYTTTVLADPVVVPDTAPAPTPAVDPPVILLDKTQTATEDTIQSIGVETDGVVSGGNVAIGFCTAADPRDGELSPGVFNARPLSLAELAGTCSSLASETLVVPAYMRPIPDAGGVRKFIFSTASTTAELEGMALSQGFGQDIVTYPGGLPPPCNVALSSRPLWLWGIRTGEEADGGVLTNEDAVMKPTSIQCNASRSGTRKLSNFIQNVSLDETLYSSASYMAGQNLDLDKLIDKLDADDGNCTDPNLAATITAMRTQAAICKTATVFPIVTRDTSYTPLRITRTVYRYRMKLKLRNYGGLVSTAQAVVRSGMPSTTIVGGTYTKVFASGISAAVGSSPAETLPVDDGVFYIDQDRTLPVDVGVLLPAVTFTPDLTADPTRYTAAVAACEQVARLAKLNRDQFDSCPANIRAKKYRGALISAGLGAAFTIYDRLARPTPGGSWSIYPLPTDIVESGQIPPSPP